MKIIQIIPEFGYGGAESMLEALAGNLKQQGNMVDVISLYITKTEHVDRLEKEGIRVILLGKKKDSMFPQYGG